MILIRFLFIFPFLFNRDGREHNEEPEPCAGKGVKGEKKEWEEFGMGAVGRGVGGGGRE